MTTIVDTGYLPIWYDEQGGSYRLLQQESFESTRLRLTPPEARAVEEALEKGQVAEGLRTYLDVVRRAFWPTQAVAQAMRSLASEPHEAQSATELSRHDGGPLLATLEVLSQALHGQQQVNFSYRGVKDDAPRERTVLPLNLFSRSGYFYLSALDMERQAERQFRTDRMSDVSARALSAEQRELVRKLSRRIGGAAWLDEAPRVTLRFADPSWAELFEWEGMDELARGTDGLWYATIPDLGGSWLPRHLVACAPYLCTSDPSLAARARAYAGAL
jgi:predicted DNA-binding transcriptional regulator YafY